jgi:ferredoxin
VNDAFTMRLLPQGIDVPLAAGQTLLEGALAAGLTLRKACRNGSCRECMAQVLHGRVRHRIDWPGLLAEEKEQGWVLPCVAVAQSDVVLRQEPA